MNWNRRHLLDVRSLSAEELRLVLSTAKAFKAVLVPTGLLSTLGVVVTAGAGGLAFHYLAGWPLSTSFLLSVLISSTDAAAVFSIRPSMSRFASPTRRLTPVGAASRSA